MKYPKVEKTYVFCQIPALNSNKKWVASFLNEDGTTTENGYAEHHTEESCWVVCRAYNNRLGFTDEEVKKAIKKTGRKEKNNKGSVKAKSRKKR